MKTEKTNAIVLRRTNYGEADRIIQLLTPFGKRSVMAKGVRREKSRLAGGIELFAICEVALMRGKGEIDTLVSSRLSHFYSHIVEDYDRLQFAYQAIKIVSQASENTDGEEWYDVLSEVLAALDVKSIRLELVETWFYARYSKILGYELSLWHDNLGEKIVADHNYRYDVSEKSFVKDASGVIGSEHIKLLRLITTKSLKVLAQIGGIENVLSECRHVAYQHVSL